MTDRSGVDVIRERAKQVRKKPDTVSNLKKQVNILRKEISTLKLLSPYCNRKDCIDLDEYGMCEAHCTAEDKLSRNCYKKRGDR